MEKGRHTDALSDWTISAFDAEACEFIAGFLGLVTIVATRAVAAHSCIYFHEILFQ